MLRCIGVVRSGWLTVLLEAALASVAFAGDQPELFAPGPAASEKQPAAASEADPFAAGPGAVPDLADAQRRAAQAEMLLERAVALIQWDFDRANQDHIVLDDALMLLNARLGSPSAGSVLANLAQQSWERPATEPVRDFVARLDKQAQGRSDEAKARLDETLEQLGKLARRPTQLNWRTQREMWLELVELMLLTKSDQDVIARWQQAATTHAEVADLYRMAHLLSVREAKAGKLDYNFVKPLFHGARRGPERMRWTAETLTTLLAASVEADAPERVEARKTLLDDLRDSSQPVYAESDLVGSLGELYRSARAWKESEAASLLETILTHCHSSFFVQFANQAGIPAVEQRQLLLAKPVRVKANHDTLGKAINYLAQQAGTPLWIDLEMTGQGSEVPVAACDGPWLVTVEKVLSGTEYRLHLLSPDLFWIGHADQFESARKAYLDGFSKSRWADAKPAAALMDSTRMEFIDTPLSQVLDFLRDQHDINLILLGTDDPPVTLRLLGTPLHVALSVMTQSLKCDWCADRGVVFVGPREELQRVEQEALPGLRRWARVGIVDSAVTKALRDETRLEFVETPLEQVAQFLSDQHEVPVRVAESHRQDPVTLYLKGVTLEQGLDTLCLKLGLAWDTDGQSISLGEGR